MLGILVAAWYVINQSVDSVNTKNVAQWFDLIDSNCLLTIGYFSALTNKATKTK